MDKYITDTFGIDNLDKVKKNMKDGAVESKRIFYEKYPNADPTKFVTSSTLDSNGDISKYTVFYKVDDVTSYDITSDTFLSNKKWTWYLYQWEKIWSINGTIQPYIRNLVGLSYKINSFRIYASNDLFFDANFPELVVNKNRNSNNITDNAYMAAIFAAYIATYVCGICTKHLEYNDVTPRTVTSISRFHLYHTMRRFLRNPAKMNKYITNDIRSTIIRNLPHATYKWSDTKFRSGKDSVFSFKSEFPPGSVRNIRPIMSKNNVSGQIGLNYEERGAVIIPEGDYRSLIATESNGLTRVGQLLFQHSVESYVYSILGAQASTRWSIVGKGASSIQTQDVYLKKVEDTIIQDDQIVAISNMRTAIKDTNVILNTAISPGMILIPSNMIILTKSISGYNNVLTHAGKGMKFGINDAVNYLEDDTDGVDKVEPTKSDTTDKYEPMVTESDRSTVISRNPGGTYTTDIYLLVITLISGAVISRYIL